MPQVQHSPTSLIRSSVRFGALLAIGIGALLPAIAPAGTPIVAVFSKTRNGYTRTILPDNTFKPETYAFADGGRLGGVFADPSIDGVKFIQVAGVVATELKRQNYIQTTNPRTADLLIFVSFGTTSGYNVEEYQSAMTGLSAGFSSMATSSANISGGGMTSSPQGLGMSGIVNTQAVSDDLSNFWGIDGALNQIALANQVRDQTNRYNAGILGYQMAWNETNVMRPYLQTARDILEEIEQSRYFVVLQAFDFQELRQRKHKKLLWETRYSIPRQGVQFDDQLIDMTRYASQFCGQDVNRLIRRHLPEGHVKMGTPTVVPTSAK